MTARALLRPFVLARDLLLTLLVLPFLLPLRVLPWNAACALGSLYGLAAWTVMGTARRAGLVNLRRAYGPSMSRAAAGRAVRAVFANLGRSLAEGVRFSAVAAGATDPGRRSTMPRTLRSRRGSWPTRARRSSSRGTSAPGRSRCRCWTCGSEGAARWWRGASTTPSSTLSCVA